MTNPVSARRDGTNVMRAGDVHETDIWRFATCARGGGRPPPTAPVLPLRPTPLVVQKAAETQRAGRAATEPGNSAHPRAVVAQTRPPQARRLGAARRCKSQTGTRELSLELVDPQGRASNAVRAPSRA